MQHGSMKEEWKNRSFPLLPSIWAMDFDAFPLTTSWIPVWNGRELSAVWLPLFFEKLAVLVPVVFLLSFETKCQTCLMEILLPFVDGVAQLSTGSWLSHTPICSVAVVSRSLRTLFPFQRQFLGRQPVLPVLARVSRCWIC